MELSKYRLCIGFGYDYDEAVEFKTTFLAALKGFDPSFSAEVPIRQIGATIGVHTGPHPLGVGLLEKLQK